MSRRAEIYLLIGLLVVLAFIVYRAWFHSAAAPVAISASDKYEPLKVENPTLRLDLIERIRKFEYKGMHRNIFSVTLPPPTPKPGTSSTAGPAPPPGPPALEVPVKFFGYAADVRTGRRRAFFTNGEDVYIVGEGETLLGRFRLLRIGNTTADVEEMASGRRATLVLEETAPQGPSA